MPLSILGLVLGALGVKGVAAGEPGSAPSGVAPAGGAISPGDCDVLIGLIGRRSVAAPGDCVPANGDAGGRADSLRSRSVLLPALTHHAIWYRVGPKPAEAERDEIEL